MTSIFEKSGGTFEGIKLLLCENPLPPIDEAIAAAQAEIPHSNYYTEPYSEALRRFIAEGIGVPQRLVHINALGDPILGPGFMRVTTALPHDNACVVQVLRELL
jgi:histidinol-phosphate aminotransferase